MQPIDLSHQDQGALMDCIYCKYIEPKFQGTENCPICHGKSLRFQAARMMDHYTSGQEILSLILQTRWDEDPIKLKEQLYSLLIQVDLYQFDMKNALINKLKELYNVS